MLWLFAPALVAETGPTLRPRQFTITEADRAYWAFPPVTAATSPRPMGLDHERLTDFLNGLNHKRTGGVEAQPGRGIIA